MKLYDFFGRMIRVGDEILYPRSNHVMMYGVVTAVHDDHIEVQRIATSGNRWDRTANASRGARTLNSKLKPYSLYGTYAVYVIPNAS